MDINATNALKRSCHLDHFWSFWTCDCIWLAIKSKEEQAVLLEVVWWHHEGNVGAKWADATRGRPAPCLVPSPWCHCGAWCHHCGHRNKHLEQVWTAATGVSCKGWRDKQATKHSIPAWELSTTITATAIYLNLLSTSTKQGTKHSIGEWANTWTGEVAPLDPQDIFTGPQPRQTLTTSHLKDSISMTPLLREETRASTSVHFHKIVILSSFVVSSQVLQFLWLF